MGRSGKPGLFHCIVNATKRHYILNQNVKVAHFSYGNLYQIKMKKSFCIFQIIKYWNVIVMAVRYAFISLNHQFMQHYPYDIVVAVNLFGYHK